MNEIKELEEKLQEAVDIINFYADPMTYFAVAFLDDKPSGEIMQDFSETELGFKPGEKAREWILKNCELNQPKDKL